MKFTVGWLKDYLDFDCSLIQLSHKLTSIGLEVENIKSPIINPDKFIVCEVIEVEKHPNADKLKVCDVSDGKENYKIVCGAENVKNGLESNHFQQKPMLSFSQLGGSMWRLF